MTCVIFYKFPGDSNKQISYCSNQINLQKCNLLDDDDDDHDFELFWWSLQLKLLMEVRVATDSLSSLKQNTYRSNILIYISGWDMFLNINRYFVCDSIRSSVKNLLFLYIVITSKLMGNFNLFLLLSSLRRGKHKYWIKLFYFFNQALGVN